MNKTDAVVQMQRQVQHVLNTYTDKELEHKMIGLVMEWYAKGGAVAFRIATKDSDG